MLAYLVIVRPYKEKLAMILSIVNECFLIVILATTTKFLDISINATVAKQLGSSCIGLTVGLIVVNWVGIIGYSVYRYRQRKGKETRSKEKTHIEVTSKEALKNQESDEQKEDDANEDQGT